MRKIRGGIMMNTMANLKDKIAKEKKQERYCSIYKSLEESLKQVKLHRKGKIHLNTWDEYLKKKSKEH